MAEQPTTATQMHWEVAKLFWDGPGADDRRQVWFSHRDSFAFGPDEYDDVLWRLGEAGFEPVAYQALPAAGDDGGVGGPALRGAREVTLFKRPLGTEPTPPPHRANAEGNGLA